MKIKAQWQSKEYLTVQTVNQYKTRETTGGRKISVFWNYLNFSVQAGTVKRHAQKHVVTEKTKIIVYFM